MDFAATLQTSLGLSKLPTEHFSKAYIVLDDGILFCVRMLRFNLAFRKPLYIKGESPWCVEETVCELVNGENSETDGVLWSSYPQLRAIQLN